MFKPAVKPQTQPLDMRSDSMAPKPSNPSQMILLHALVTIVLSYQLLFSIQSLLRFELQELVVLALIVSVVGLVKIPTQYWTRAWFVSALVIADTLTTTAIIYSSGQASSGLYMAYFLIILIAAFAPTLTQMIWLSTVLCLTYAGVLYLEVGQLGTPLEGHLLQVPVLLILAMFYGVTIDAVRKLDREKSSLVVDLEEQKRVERALRESKEHFEAFMDSNPSAAFMKDLEGRYIYANKSFEQRFNLDKPSWYGRTDTNLWPPDVAQAVRKNDHMVLAERRTFQFQETMPLPHLGVRSWMVLKFPLRDSLGHQYLGGLAMELTEREQLEAQFRQAQRLEMVGRLAGGIAHDFNNLLLVILGHCDLLIKFLGLQPKVRSQIEEIKKSGERAASLTQQLLAFSRRQVLQPKVLDLNAIISNVERMLRRVIGEDIRLVTRLGEDLGCVEVDPSQMDQVIMNLAINARDAMPEGGELTIETRTVVFKKPPTISGIAIQAGPYVILDVCDTGNGMDAETKAKIFEPFFTTKEVGKGTGLGLSTVYGIVKQSGGYIFADSEVGRGSHFTIYLPQAQEAPAPVLAGNGSAHTQDGWETVLLVEDDATVRNLLRSVLHDQGYTILEASSGPEALRISDHRLNPIHLVITDMILPGGLNGRELAEGLRTRRPELKILYMSGYTEDMILRCGGVAHAASFLQKPFTPEVLADKVRHVLGQSGRPHELAPAP